MQECDLAARRLQQHEAIVLHRHVPEIGVGEAIDLYELAEEPACQIYEMDALVDQLPAAGAARLRPPLARIAGAAAMAVAGTYEQQLAERA